MTTKYPPQLSVGEAVRVIKEMYSTHKGKDVSIDLMPEILRISRKSSYFPACIATLQKFGLVEKRPHSILELTDLAMQIIEPIGNEDEEAKFNLFRKDEVLSALLDKYPNGKLPSEEQLKQTLMKTFGVPRDTVSRWFQFVLESFRELPTNHNRKDDNVAPIGGNVVSNIKEIFSPQVVKPISSDFQNIQLPSGKSFSFSLEDGYDLDDLEFITDFFELKKKRVKK